MTLVLDASVAIAWMFADERSEVSRQALRQALHQGAAAPSLWRLEVANVLRKAVRRGRCDHSYADRSLKRLARVNVVIDAHTDRHAWGDTRRLALAHDLTLYDAAYLELALRLELPLASHDAALARAARESNVALFGQ